MELTASYLRNWFKHFNELYFDLQLPDSIELKVSNSRTHLGKFKCNWSQHWLSGRKRISNCLITISRFYDLPEKEIHNVLLHEMIHYYIAISGKRDTAPHGKLFREQMNRLNSQFGWNITISAKTGKWTIAERNKESSFLVLAIKLKDNSHMLTVVNPNYRNEIDLKCQQITDIKEWKWYIAEDEYFAHFPRVRNLRGKKVSKDVYEEKIRGMQETG